MDACHDGDRRVARLAAAIGEPARARMLFCLMSNRARTSTELALAADVSPSTASVHLQRLRVDGLVTVLAQGRHRYWTLAGADVAGLLEELAVFTGARDDFEPTTPPPLRAARTCYDHLAGALGVSLYDHLTASGWLVGGAEDGLAVTPAGAAGFAALGIDVASCRRRRRRFAYACLDWSERRPHLGGALGAALLTRALERQWLAPNRDDRALRVTPAGRRAFGTHLGLRDIRLAAAGER